MVKRIFEIRKITISYSKIRDSQPNAARTGYSNITLTSNLQGNKETNNENKDQDLKKSTTFEPYGATAANNRLDVVFA